MAVKTSEQFDHELKQALAVIASHDWRGIQLAVLQTAYLLNLVPLEAIEQIDIVLGNREGTAFDKRATREYLHLYRQILERLIRIMEPE
jgi:hypothetical protein